MPTIILQVNKAAVWNEVAKTSGYTGDKMTDADENAYERILITDEDQKSLQRFWEEAVAVANDQLKEMLETASSMNSDYKVALHVSRSYDTVLNASVQAALTSYFISAIVGRWYKFSNKGEADSYLSEAANMMDDVLRKLYSRKRPRRPNREGTTIRPIIPDVPIITDPNN
ncbi:hypothetical protein [Muribaculum intestinale]|jgi:hypothetical protein|uniref:hypothetical protein n=1 Tax=Muribaculum intestinale TaxID=1796646 RepID=UPI0025B4A378|nr:hypothetical protein [Muribaculum intestinale]